ncbi:hypothetical protein C0J52_21767 [Blattella germanica]|nr:hypothetical protein C0J52_21767 [Blattella germanica]
MKTWLILANSSSLHVCVVTSIGRRPVFLLSLILVILGKGFVPASTHYLYYIATVFIGHSALSSLCYAASSIGIELSSSEQRANVIMLQSLGWTLGMCLIPLVAWITKDWVSFVLLPIAPSILLLIYSYR